MVIKLKALLMSGAKHDQADQGQLESCLGVRRPTMNDELKFTVFYFSYLITHTPCE